MNKNALSLPSIHPISDLPVPEVQSDRLSNNLPVYSILGGGQEVIKVELVFLAGRPYEKQKLMASACAALFREGTTNLSSAKLAEKIDFYGASISSSFTFDSIKLNLYCLSRYLPQLLPYLDEIVSSAEFPTAELEIFKERTKQRLSLDLAQNEVLAYRQATELYFGMDHPYGYNSSPQLYDAIDRDGIVEHYQRLISPQNAFCLVAGQPKSDYLELLDQFLGHWRRPHVATKMEKVDSSPNATSVTLKGNRSQTAIRIGRRLFGRSHPDFAGMFVLNTVIGGYFGSRLMRNLREDRGLTYGVESALETMRFDGYFSISLETENRLAQAAIDEIHSEIYKLQTELIGQQELQMVKNYLAGYLLSLMDGPFQMIEIVRSNLIRQNDQDFLAHLLPKIHQASPQMLKELAIRYLKIEDLTQVVVY